MWWASGALANVFLTMVSYKLIRLDDSGVIAAGLASWKWLHIICAILTFVVFVPLVIFLPNSPVDAKWLSVEEKIHTIELIRRTRAGISNSTFKWSQVRECFTDIKSWLFMCVSPIPVVFLVTSYLTPSFRPQIPHVLQRAAQ